MVVFDEVALLLFVAVAPIVAVAAVYHGDVRAVGSAVNGLAVGAAVAV